MTKKPYLSVVIPSFNEDHNIKRKTVETAYQYLCSQDYSFEIVLSDDGSTDSTLKHLKSLSTAHPEIKLVENPHRGKGPTVTSGMLAATGEWRLFSDFDFSTPIEEIEKLLKYTDQYEVIIGSRELAESKRDQEPFYRHLMGKGFNFLVKILAIPGINDTQCGFKLLSAKASQFLLPKLYIYGLDQSINDAFTGAADVELLYLARKFRYQIKEVPIHWQHYATNRVNPLKDSYRMFKDILRIRIADLQHRYD